MNNFSYFVVRTVTFLIILILLQPVVSLFAPQYAYLFVPQWNKIVILFGILSLFDALGLYLKRYLGESSIVPLFFISMFLRFAVLVGFAVVQLRGNNLEFCYLFLADLFIVYFLYLFFEVKSMVRSLQNQK